ncbi:MAG TPA: PEP-CTERM sorting domain-containing protein [Myxococcota bacterium]|nr:PEP-CTERM sorting domain-containing protein [Myxococcota bacterium]
MARHSLASSGLAAAVCLFLAASASAIPITFYNDLNSNGSYDPGEQVTGGSNGDGGATYVLSFDLDAATQNISAASITLTFQVWDNNFIVSVNGVTDVPVDNNDPAVFTPAVQTPWTANSNGLPRLVTTLGQTGISFAAALDTTTNTMTTGLAYAQPTTNPVFHGGQNTITIVNPDGPGPDALVFTILGSIPLLPIPEPGTGSLFALGLTGMAVMRRRAKARQS